NLSGRPSRQRRAEQQPPGKLSRVSASAASASPRLRVSPSPHLPVPCLRLFPLALQCPRGPIVGRPPLLLFHHVDLRGAQSGGRRKVLSSEHARVKPLHHLAGGTIVNFPQT